MKATALLTELEQIGCTTVVGRGSSPPAEEVLRATVCGAPAVPYSVSCATYVGVGGWTHAPFDQVAPFEAPHPVVVPESTTRLGHRTSTVRSSTTGSAGGPTYV